MGSGPALLVYWVQPWLRGQRLEGDGALPDCRSSPRQKLEIQPCPQDGSGSEAMLRGRLRIGAAGASFGAMVLGILLSETRTDANTYRGLP